MIPRLQCKFSIINLMAKVKYYYDSETLSYKKVAPKKGIFFKKLLFWILTIALAMFVGFFLLHNFFETPNENS